MASIMSNKKSSKKKTKELGFQCSYCNKKSKKKLKCCSRCKVVAYCNTECQTKHWENGHKQDCKKYRKMDKGLGKTKYNGRIHQDTILKTKIPVHRRNCKRSDLMKFLSASGKGKSVDNMKEIFKHIVSKLFPGKTIEDKLINDLGQYFLLSIHEFNTRIEDRVAWKVWKTQVLENNASRVLNDEEGMVFLEYYAIIGGDLNYYTENGYSFLHDVCTENGVSHVIPFLAKEGVNINQPTVFGYDKRGCTASSPLHLACMNGLVDNVVALCKLPDIDPNTINLWGSTPLRAVTELSDQEHHYKFVQSSKIRTMLEALKAAGANLHYRVQPTWINSHKKGKSHRQWSNAIGKSKVMNEAYDKDTYRAARKVGDNFMDDPRFCNNEESIRFGLENGVFPSSFGKGDTSYYDVGEDLD
eukprot:g14565.t1